MAGVSTAAPYRHFADKEELLDAVRARGFDRLTRAMRERIDALCAPGTIDEIAAIGRAYVRFARDEPDVFRLMFASRHERRPGAASGVAGATCFGTLLERVALLRRATEDAVDAELTTVALPLWSLVHGVATLEIDGGFAAVAPATSPEQVVDFATRHYLDGLVNGCGQSSA
jgi:AcrR family transcriptional regulator